MRRVRWPVRHEAGPDPRPRALGGHGTASGALVRVGSLGGLAAAGVGLSPRPWGAGRERSRVLASACSSAGPMWEQCGLYPQQPVGLDSLSSPAGPAAPTWRRGPAAWPRGGLAPGRAWAGPDSRRPPRPAAEWPEAPASSCRSPSASPPPAWWWVWGSGYPPLPRLPSCRHP